MKSQSWVWIIGGVIFCFVAISAVSALFVVRTMVEPLQLIEELSSQQTSSSELTEENNFRGYLVGGGVIVVDEIGTRLKSGQVEVWRRGLGAEVIAPEKVPVDFEFSKGYALGRVVDALGENPKLTSGCGEVTLDDKGNFRMLATTHNAMNHSFYYSDGKYVKDGRWRVGQQKGEESWQRFDQFELRTVDLAQEGLTAFDPSGNRVEELPGRKKGLAVGYPEIFIGDGDFVVEFVMRNGLRVRSERWSLGRGSDEGYEFFPFEGEFKEVTEVVRLSRIRNVITVPRMSFSVR